MIGKRAHRKSKHGCVQCKVRKVKCDERHPECKNCVRHGVQCSYQTAGLVATDENLTSTARRLSKPVVVESPGPSPTAPPELEPDDLNTLQLQLLHHYSTSTCYTVSHDPLFIHEWRVNIPKICMKASFSTRALLAIAALHLAHLDPSRREFYQHTAGVLHDTGLRTAKTIMQNISEENICQLFIFSSVTCWIACARPRVAGTLLVIDSGGVTKWAQLFRGAQSIFFAHSELLLTGPLAAFLTIGTRIGNYFSHGPFSWPEPLQILKTFILESLGSESPLLPTYEGAIAQLVSAYRCISLPISSEVSLRQCEPAAVMNWLLQVSEEYMSLLSQHAPEALGIFAYFCVLVKQAEWAWWAQGLSAHMMTSVHMHLPPECRGWIEWPAEVMGWSPPVND